MADLADDPYGTLAADHHWLLDDVELRIGSRTPGVRAALAALGPGARVLDAACGIGCDVRALHHRGVDARGTDASAAMIAEARRRTAEQLGSDEGTHVGPPPSFDVCGWDDLPSRFAAEFDLVLCTGNSIGHAADARDRRRSLAALAEVVTSEGSVVLDLHDWSNLPVDIDPADIERTTVVRDGRTCHRRLWWRRGPGGDPADRLLLVADLQVTEPDGSTRALRHEIAVQPVELDALCDDLRDVGLTRLAVDRRPGDDRITVVGRR